MIALLTQSFTFAEIRVRIETFNAAATCPEHEWLFDTFTAKDGISHLSALAEIDVIDDEIVPIPPPSGWDGPTYAQRIIRGTVLSRLHMWAERCEFFGRDDFLGGISLPEEKKIYQMGGSSVAYDESTNVLEVRLLETIYQESPDR